MKNVQLDLTFIFTELSEISNSFCENTSSTRDKKRWWFHKNTYLLKTRLQKMRKHVETFHADKSYKSTTVVFIPTSQFSEYEL